MLSKLLLIIATAFLLQPAFANNNQAPLSNCTPGSSPTCYCQGAQCWDLGDIGGECCPFSDAGLKTNVQTLDDATKKVLQLRGVSFDWKADKKADIGVIAQEVQKVYPQVVKEKGGLLQVDYEKLVAPLIEATRELDARIKVLETAKPANAH